MSSIHGEQRFSARGRFLASVGALVLALPIFSAEQASAATVKYDDVLLLLNLAGTNSSPTLLTMHPSTGETELVSDFGDPAQGPTIGGFAASVVVTPKMEIYVTDFSFSVGKIFKVNPANGKRTIVSDFSTGNPTGGLTPGMALDAAGRLVLGMNVNSLVRVDPKTDTRNIVTDFSNAVGEESGRVILDVAVEPSTGIAITTSLCNPDVNTAIVYHVDLSDGTRTVWSDFTKADQGVVAELCWFSAGAMADSSGNLLVNTANVVPIGTNFVVRVDAATGNRTIVSNFDDPSQGPLGLSLTGLDLTATGDIIVSAQADQPDTFFSSVFKVNPVTGQRTILARRVGGIVDLAVVKRKK